MCILSTPRTLQVWTEEMYSALQDCFEFTNLEVFQEGTDLDGYTSVMSHLKFCTDAFLLTLTIEVFPKPKTIARQHSEAPHSKPMMFFYRSGDKLAYK